MKIAILGGTGALGLGLASRWIRSGHEVLIGSRTIESAKSACGKLNINEDQGMLNVDAANQGSGSVTHSSVTDTYANLTSTTASKAGANSEYIKRKTVVATTASTLANIAALKTLVLDGQNNVSFTHNAIHDTRALITADINNSAGANVFDKTVTVSDAVTISQGHTLKGLVTAGGNASGTLAYTKVTDSANNIAG